MAEAGVAKMSARERLVATLTGRKPDRYPFIGRLELWQKGRLYSGTLPPEYAGVPLSEIHRDVGFGRQKMLAAYRLRLAGVEMTVRHEGEVITRETDPLLERFPDVTEVLPENRVGETTVEFRSAAGTISVEYIVLASMLETGARAYMRKHPITCDDDYAVIERMMERAEVVLEFERLHAVQAELGENGYVMPVIERIPFQQALIDFLSTDRFFFALHDNPVRIERLMALLDERIMYVLGRAAALDVPYVEFVDNVDGVMTNPRLFRRFSLDAYQRYSAIAHGQGKRIGSHMDGNIRQLLPLIAESGLDVIESFSPAPLTPCTVQEANAAWQGKPIIWGGIPSPLLEENTSETEFEAAIQRLLDELDGRPMILNVADMVLPNNDIGRVRRIAEMIEARPL